MAISDGTPRLGLGQRRRAFLPDHVGVPGGGDHLLQPHGQRGQRGAQLMRGVSGEVPLGGQQVGDPPRRAVQPLGQPVELGHAVPAAQWARVADAEPVGRAGQFFQRPGQPPGLQHGQRHRHRQGGQRKPADQGEGSGQPPVLDRVVGGHGDLEVPGLGQLDDRARLRWIAAGELGQPVLPDADVPVGQRNGRRRFRDVGRQARVDPVLQRLGHRGRVPLDLLARRADLQPADHEGERDAEQQDSRHRHHQGGDQQAAAHGSASRDGLGGPGRHQEAVSHPARSGSPRHAPW
jgi:hypothetical protein